jgi:hypothetical protein
MYVMWGSVENKRGLRAKKFGKHYINVLILMSLTAAAQIVTKTS